MPLEERTTPRRPAQQPRSHETMPMGRLSLSVLLAAMVHAVMSHASRLFLGLGTFSGNTLGLGTAGFCGMLLSLGNPGILRGCSGGWALQSMFGRCSSPVGSRATALAFVPSPFLAVFHRTLKALNESLWFRPRPLQCADPCSLQQRGGGGGWGGGAGGGRGWWGWWGCRSSLVAQSGLLKPCRAAGVGTACAMSPCEAVWYNGPKPPPPSPSPLSPPTVAYKRSKRQGIQSKY